MKKLNKELKKLLIISLVITAMLISGIPFIIFGATKNITLLLVVGIAFTAVGFYGTPIAWVMYGEKHKLKRVVFAITGEHLMTVQKIASQLQLSEDTVRNYLTTCFNKGYLIGYLRDGDNIIENKDMADKDRLISVKCEFCGAPYTFKASDPNPLCPYCRSARNTQK